MAMAALREASRSLASTRNPATVRPCSSRTPAASPTNSSSEDTLPVSSHPHSRVPGISQFATEDSLAEAFSRYGQVIEATIVTEGDQQTKRILLCEKLASEEEANNARDEMNGKVLNGRVIHVDIAKAKPDRVAGALPIARGPSKTICNN